MRFWEVPGWMPLLCALVPNSFPTHAGHGPQSQTGKDKIIRKISGHNCLGGGVCPKILASTSIDPTQGVDIKILKATKIKRKENLS